MEDGERLIRTGYCCAAMRDCSEKKDEISLFYEEGRMRRATFTSVQWLLGKVNVFQFQPLLMIHFPW